jgi:NAD(P)-dependent dehydrogenase (short-subunit alcohol dehydrogenase family)
MLSLKDKTVLIIGRGSGIARAIAMAVGEDGGRVIVAGRHPDERKAALFKARSETAPARRIGTADDIAAVALAVLANRYLTGASIPVDGGEHLV